MTTPTVVHKSDDLLLATWSRVFINRWRTAATSELLSVVMREQLAFIDSFDDRKIAVLTTLEDSSGVMPNSASRKKAEEVAKATRESLILQAQVVQGDGFVAAAFRALLSGITLAIRAPYPTKVFKTEEEAMPWVAEQLKRAGHGDDAAGVAAAVESLTW